MKFAALQSTNWKASMEIMQYLPSNEKYNGEWWEWMMVIFAKYKQIG